MNSWKELPTSRKLEKLQSELYVTKNVNTLLSNEIDDLQQYQRQHCILIDGLRTSPSETSDQVTEKVEKVLIGNLQFDPEEVNCQIDACHRIEPINTKDGMQSTIVRFKTHSFREAVYLKRRKCNKKQKIKLSLTQRRRKTHICLQQQCWQVTWNWLLPWHTR